jgi:hypothetical protein
MIGSARARDVKSTRRRANAAKDEFREFMLRMCDNSGIYRVVNYALHLNHR